jgi:hypothetical protein
MILIHLRFFLFEQDLIRAVVTGVNKCEIAFRKLHALIERVIRERATAGIEVENISLSHYRSEN